MKINEYNQLHGLIRWELYYEGLFLVLLKENSLPNYDNKLLAFKPFGKLLWTVSPATQQKNDGIVNIWFEKGSLFAGSHSGYELKVDIESGNVVETKFTR